MTANRAGGSLSCRASALQPLPQGGRAWRAGARACGRSGVPRELVRLGNCGSSSCTRTSSRFPWRRKGFRCVRRRGSSGVCWYRRKWEVRAPLHMTSTNKKGIFKEARVRNQAHEASTSFSYSY
ncbi:hypothetical protein M5K25_012629 [Dendrobium thyrsiflorum]|uniref:Uncharacterized protein n=1 Tax=Dendrobium thyrsiflorum TaxID=117978 RepID=A0ABD0UXN5_DENTH